jgi:hypothetical protein
MAVPDAVPADAPVFREPAEVRPALRPCPGEAESLHGEHWWDADRGAVHPAAHHKADAIPEARPDQKDAGAGRLAVREPRLAGDGLALVPASVFHRASHAWRLAGQVSAAAALYKQGAGRFAA